MEEQIPSPKSGFTSLSPKDLFFKYLRFLPLFVISIALSLLVAFIYLRYATLIYRASSSIIIKDDKTTPKGSDRFDQVLESGGTKDILNEIEVLKSRPLMARVVEALDLDYTYYAKGSI